MCVDVFYFLFKNVSEMESNKENVHRLKPITRIPLPVDPLPALPKHLLKTKTDKEEIVRHPLKILSKQHENVARASSSQVQSQERVATKKKVLKIDTRFVTVRPKALNIEPSDWEYKVYNDHDEKTIQNERINNSDDSERNGATSENEQNCLGEAPIAITPSIQSIEHKGVRNIKRSLKRPHSRELQGLSPVVKQEQRVDEKVKRRLQFNGLQERLKSPDYWEKAYMSCMTKEFSRDIFEYLLAVERKPLDVPRTATITRACIVNWLNKVNGPGNPAVVQAACWYFDSILGTGHVAIDKLQLIASACYWIAQKLYGPVVSAKRLIRCSAFAFTGDKLVAAEKAILERLKFPMQPVVPQEFITYLAWWCDPNHPGEIEVAATFVCMCALIVDKELSEEFPSVIAAAAVRNALLLVGKADLTIRLTCCPVYQAAEKKTSSLSGVGFILRRAVRTISASSYDYKTPLEHYGDPPFYIAQRVSHASGQLAVTDCTHAKRKEKLSFQY